MSERRGLRKRDKVTLSSLPRSENGSSPTHTSRARSLPLIAAFLAALFYVLTHGGLYYPDMTNALREGMVLGLPTAYPVMPPAHTLILDSICLLVRPPLRMVVLVVLQQAAVVGSVWCVLTIVESANYPRLAIVAASMVALYAQLYAFAQTSQSEVLFVLFALAAARLTIRSWSPNATRTSALLAGAGVGLAMAQRSVGVALVPAIALAIAAGRVEGKGRLAARLSAGFVLVLALFVASNRVVHGFTGLTGGSGIHLFGRLATVDKRLPVSDAARQLLDIAHRHGIENVFIPQAGWRLHPVLAWREGLGPVAADALLRKVVLQAWLAAPVQTVRDTLRAMALIAARARSSGRVTLGGLGPDGFVRHLRIADDIWATELPVLMRFRNQFPPYPPPETFGPKVYPVFQAWSDASTVLRGAWVIPAMMVAILIGLWQRERVVLLTGTTAFALLAAAAAGDTPVTRHWHVAVPFFVMSIVLATAEFMKRCQEMARSHLSRRAVAATDRSEVTVLSQREARHGGDLFAHSLEPVIQRQFLERPIR
jgi:hypothetical protein